jgi:hypothetical protein
MSSGDLENLKRRYAGRPVTVDRERPELARLAGLAGRVIAVNCNGFALVQFEGPNPAWHDINPEYLELEPSP